MPRANGPARRDARSRRSGGFGLAEDLAQDAFVAAALAGVGRPGPSGRLARGHRPVSRHRPVAQAGAAAAQARGARARTAVAAGRPQRAHAAPGGRTTAEIARAFLVPESTSGSSGPSGPRPRRGPPSRSGADPRSPPGWPRSWACSTSPSTRATRRAPVTTGCALRGGAPARAQPRRVDSARGGGPRSRRAHGDAGVPLGRADRPVRRAHAAAPSRTARDGIRS